MPFEVPAGSVHKAGSSHRMALKSRRIALGTVGSRVAKRVLMDTIFRVFESIWAKWRERSTKVELSWQEFCLKRNK